MAVTISNGIGFSKNSGAAYIDMAAVKKGVADNAPEFTRTPADKSASISKPWAPWGANNLLPMEMLADIDSCGILSGITDGKARFAVCNGVLPALVRYDKKGQMVIDDILLKAEIMDFLDDNNHYFQTYGWMRDLCGFGNAEARFMLNGGRDKIVGVQRDDITEMRYEVMDKAGKINNIFLSAYWDKVASESDERLLKLPLLDPNNPLKDLRERVASSKDVEFAMTLRYPSWGRKYYSNPLWYAALKWVKIAIGVPEMKAAMFENNFRPKYLVIMSDKYWDRVFAGKDANGDDKSIEDYTPEEIEKKKGEVYDQIDEYLSGNKNAYKAVFCDGTIDPVTGKLNPEIDIRTIDDTTKAGELLPDSAAANSEIAFSMMVNPAIFGATMPSGPYTSENGGSSVRESVLLQVIIHELERRLIRSIFNVIKRFNGWDKEYAKEGTRLEFIIPATIPTTLDTGSNVKEIVTGASPAKKEAA